MNRLRKYFDQKGVEIREVEGYSKLELSVRLSLEEDALHIELNFLKEVFEDPEYKAKANERTKENVMKRQKKIFSQFKEYDMDNKQYENISEKTDQTQLGEMIEKYRRRQSSSHDEKAYKERIERYKKEEDRGSKGYQGPYKKKYFNREDKKYYNDREFKDRSRSRDLSLIHI